MLCNMNCSEASPSFSLTQCHKEQEVTSFILILLEWCNFFIVDFFLSLYACALSHFTRVRLFVTLWTVACQALLSMGFFAISSSRGSSRPRNWTHISSVISLMSYLLSLWQVGSLPLAPLGCPCIVLSISTILYVNFQECPSSYVGEEGTKKEDPTGEDSFFKRINVVKIFKEI